VVKIRVQFGMVRAQCGIDKGAVWHMARAQCGIDKGAVWHMTRAQCGTDKGAVWHGKGSVWFR